MHMRCESENFDLLLFGNVVPYCAMNNPGTIAADVVAAHNVHEWPKQCPFGGMAANSWAHEVPVDRDGSSRSAIWR
jgi:hypothetical protein